MRLVRGLVVLAAVACNGDKDSSDKHQDDTGTSNTGPLKFTFKSEVQAVGYEADVADQAVAAHRISTLFLAATAVVSADEKVQDRLNVNGNGGYLRAANVECWDRPEFPMFSFAIDYTPCKSLYDLDGGVFVNDHPAGPLLYQFQDFSIKNRRLGGVLGFDVDGAYVDPYSQQPYWLPDNTHSDNPGPDSDVEMSATVDGTNYGVAYTGGASVSFKDQQWSMWGVLDIGFDQYTHVQVIHGGVAPGDVPGDDPTDATVDTSSLDWLSCRCPTSGVEGMDLPLHFTKVTVDLDDLEQDPDAIDDPVLDLDIDYELPGSAELTHTGCGKYDMDYTADPVSIPISTDQIIGAISFQCATLEIDDEERCNALLAAANALTEGVTATITPDQTTQTALDAINSDFDTTWCHVQ